MWVYVNLFNAFTILAPRPFEEGHIADAKPAASLTRGDFIFCPVLIDFLKAFGNRHGVASELDTPRLCRRNAFGLSLPYELPFRLRIGKQLQDDIRNQGAGEVAPLPRVQKREVCLCQVETKNLFLCCELSPGPAPRPIEEMRP